MKILQILLFFGLVAVLGGCVSQTNRAYPQPSYPITPTQNSTSSVEAVEPAAADQADSGSAIEIEPVAPVVADSPQPVDTQPVIGQFVDYPVPFSSQAPFGVWDELHQETCEEASMVMAVRFFKNQELNSHLMEQELLNIFDWETQNGYRVDLTADEVVVVLDKYFNQSSRIMTDVSVAAVTAELDKGNLVIVPAAGRNLGNPYFTPPGPIYHMLLIRGYDRSTGEFITNDPGTKRGEGYRYQYQTLLSAVADWNHALAEGGMEQSEIEQGRKVLISVIKP